MQTVIAVLMLLAAASSVCVADAQRTETKLPYTSFQTPTPYMPENDIRTGAVIVYSNDKAAMQSWKDKGFVVQTMYGFRTGDDYIKDHRDEVQTWADGTLHTCGPGSYYMVPTPSRVKAAVDYFTTAIANGTSAVIPEEPEFFAQTGYSESFKKAWQEHYGEPWQDQTTSIVARYKSERLKAKMELDMVKAIMAAAEKQNAAVRRMVAIHSAVSYYAWGIIFPHYECLTTGNIQEIIGQVWTGTARTPCKYAGVDAERTFEFGLLEYSSLYNLARGTGKRLWFLMDPLEDNQDRSMEDYNSNYIKTLLASLMFPEVDSYEVMPWPTRIYGRVPDSFATEIGSIVMALNDMHNHKTAKLDVGTQGIATFVADSMGWQRGAPGNASFDAFYGLTLPLIYRGVPVQVAQLERVVEKDYLKDYKVILLSYDLLKPMKPEYNQAIADWVKQGGVLVFSGGNDAYNALPEWWAKSGFASPQADLYSRLGVKDAVSSKAFERKIGKGLLIHAGQAPAHYASSPEAAKALVELARNACKSARVEWKEQQWMGVKRGPYVGVRTFDGERKLKGAFVNLLEPTLPLEVDPVVAPQQCAFYYEVSTMSGEAPFLLYSSSKVEEKSETAGSMTLKLSGPLKTKGTARLYTGDKTVGSVAPEGVKVEKSGKTMLLTYDNSPESVDIKVVWR